MTINAFLYSNEMVLALMADLELVSLASSIELASSSLFPNQILAILVVR